MIPVEDLLSVLDVLAIDEAATTDFGAAPLSDKMRLAVEDWLCPRLAQHGYPVERHKARRPALAAFGYTSNAFSGDVAVPLASFDDETNLADVLAGAGDYLYIGLDRPFRGLFVGMTDTVNTNTLTPSVQYWNGGWSTFSNSLVNGTLASGVPFARAGRILWPTPTDWISREVNDSRAYWVRLGLSAAPTAAMVEQLVPISRSRLTHAVALKTLALLYAEGAVNSRGDWATKAEEKAREASAHLELVIGMVADEFDLDGDGVAEPEDAAVDPQPVPWTWERG